jgi:hypothetical protein
VTVRPSRVGLTFAVLLAVAALGAQPAAAVPPTPPTLAGEGFLTNSVTASGCNLALAFTFFTYRASGRASGPYPGRFAESGTVYIGQQNVSPPAGSIVPLGPVLAWSADFTISSRGRVVTGTGSVLGPPPNPPFAGLFGACTDNAIGDCGTTCLVTKIRDATANLSYEAQIEDREYGACFLDHGSALATAQAVAFAPPDDALSSSTFLGNFTSNRTRTESAKCKGVSPAPAGSGRPRG